jgi:hypothetical protein
MGTRHEPRLAPLDAEAEAVRDAGRVVDLCALKLARAHRCENLGGKTRLGDAGTEVWNNRKE